MRMLPTAFRSDGSCGAGTELTRLLELNRQAEPNTARRSSSEALKARFQLYFRDMAAFTELSEANPGCDAGCQSLLARRRFPRELRPHAADRSWRRRGSRFLRRVLVLVKFGGTCHTRFEHRSPRSREVSCIRPPVVQELSGGHSVQGQRFRRGRLPRVLPEKHRLRCRR